VPDNLLAQGMISSEVVGVYFDPTGLPSPGELTFGGVDNSKITSPVAYVPITSEYPASEFWGVDQSVSYGDQIILSGAGIVDTGTTLILLSDGRSPCNRASQHINPIIADAYNDYKDSTGGVEDDATGLLRITYDQYSALQPLNFHIGDNTYTLNPNAQIWPRSLNANIGGSADFIYLVIGDVSLRILSSMVHRALH
jgi:saccharopepsin